MTIITIQSQVVHGKVGNSVAVPVLQAHGLTVAPVPTTLLSNHPHYPTMRGRVLPAELLRDLLLGVEERGLVEKASAIMTGYLGSVENGEVVAEFVKRAKLRNPRLTYVCDPVCGDDDLGAFVEPGLQRLFSERLLPLADLATPNAWELSALMGHPDIRAAAARLFEHGTRRIVVTGGAVTGDTLATFVFEPEQPTSVIRTPRLDVRPAGTGDLFSAVLTAKLVSGLPLAEATAAAIAAVFAVLQRTSSEPWSEMPLERCLTSIISPDRAFALERLDGQP